MQEGPAPAGTTKRWNLQMEVPPIPPSNLVNCSIIDLDYDFKVCYDKLLQIARYKKGIILSAFLKIDLFL